MTRWIFSIQTFIMVPSLRQDLGTNNLNASRYKIYILEETEF